MEMPAKITCPTRLRRPPAAHPHQTDTTTANKHLDHLADTTSHLLIPASTTLDTAKARRHPSKAATVAVLDTVPLLLVLLLVNGAANKHHLLLKATVALVTEVVAMAVPVVLAMAVLLHRSSTRLTDSNLLPVKALPAHGTNTQAKARATR